MEAVDTSVESFCALFESWLGETDLFPEGSLHIDLLVNPHAGAFRHKRRLRQLLISLRAQIEADKHRSRGPSTRSVTVDTKFATPEMPEMTPHPIGPDRHLVVVAGGDGTSRAALISALGMTREEKSKLLFFRLPLGTGNDAADTPDFETGLAVLSGRSNLGFQPQKLALLEVTSKKQGPHFSFNIASVGLDAWVVSLTNRFRKVLPGNTYSLMVDAASLFYEWAHKIVPMKVTVLTAGKVTADWNRELLLVAFGTSGNRTYGAGKKILPDADNLVLAHKLGLFTKLSYRHPIYEGTHRGLAGIEFASGDTLIVDQAARLPLQLDGEEEWLEPDDFPLVMKRLDSGLQTLSAGANS